MTFSIHGQAVTRGVAIGRAVLVAATRLEVKHYFIQPEHVPAELERLRRCRDAVLQELGALKASLGEDAPPEAEALLDVHMLLLQDESLIKSIQSWVTQRLYNSEWALVTQLEVISRQFDEMEDAYLRERKADLEQIFERLLWGLRDTDSGTVASDAALGSANLNTIKRVDGLPLKPQKNISGTSLVLVAHDLSPADMLQFKQSVFAGFITDVGGVTSHTAIVARSMGIPAVVGARNASQIINQDDWVIIDGDAGVVVVDPSATILAEYNYRRRQRELEREQLERLRYTPTRTLDGQRVSLQVNIELPDDAQAAFDSGADGIGLFRTEFLFMGRSAVLPGEREQYEAYAQVVRAMQGKSVTFRTVDVGADKSLDQAAHNDEGLNPALGLRAIRWCLKEPAMFRTQLRALLRAATLGPVRIMIPMIATMAEVSQTKVQLDLARSELVQQGTPFGAVEIGAMIEVPSAALQVEAFLRHFDFLSIGTNDLIQYTLAIDRADASVAHLYDPCNPAVLRLTANVIAACRSSGKDVSVCGEMASDAFMTRLLLGLGLRNFSMHPAQLLNIKQEILRADARKLESWAQQVLASENPASMLNVAG